MFYIAPGIHAERWRALELDDAESPDWHEAVGIFEKRIKSRYLRPVEVLIRMDKRKEMTKRQFGFTILAIDCLLVETLQAFRLGLTDTRRRSEEMFRKFLTERARFCEYFDDERAKRFFKDVRCGILHQAEVRGGWKVWSEGVLLAQTRSGFIVNRTRFHEWLVRELEEYQEELRRGEDLELRRCFRLKMDDICSGGIKR